MAMRLAVVLSLCCSQVSQVRCCCVFVFRCLDGPADVSNTHKKKKKRHNKEADEHVALFIMLYLFAEDLQLDFSLAQDG